MRPMPVKEDMHCYISLDFRDRAKQRPQYLGTKVADEEHDVAVPVGSRKSVYLVPNDGANVQNPQNLPNYHEP